MKRSLVLIGTLLMVAAGGTAQAQKKPPARAAAPKKDAQANPFIADVMVLHATNGKKGIDKRIGDLPELKKPPFSSYDSYQLLKRAKLPLQKGEPKTVKLPNGRVLKTSLLQVLPKDQLRLSASINQPNGEDFLPVLQVNAKVGQRFIVAGQSYKGGILVLVIRVTR